MKYILLVLAAVAAAPLAQAQSDDKAYCTQLSELYRKYVQNATGRRIDVEALQALDDCSRGRAAAAIPVLEKRLRDAKITPPGGGEVKPEYPESQVPDTAMLSSRAERGTFPVASKAPRYARGDSREAHNSDSRC